MEIPPPSSEPPCAAWGLRMNGTSPALTATADGRHSLPRSQGKHNFVLISLVEQSSKPGIGKRKCWKWKHALSLEEIWKFKQLKWVYSLPISPSHVCPSSRCPHGQGKPNTDLPGWDLRVQMASWCQSWMNWPTRCSVVQQNSPSPISAKTKSRDPRAHGRAVWGAVSLVLPPVPTELRSEIRAGSVEPRLFWKTKSERKEQKEVQKVSPVKVPWQQEAGCPQIVPC